MKICKTDNLGRIVLPIGFRKTLSITENTELIVSLKKDAILITPKETLCKICGEAAFDKRFSLCKKCIEEIKKISF